MATGYVGSILYAIVTDAFFLRHRKILHLDGLVVISAIYRQHLKISLEGMLSLINGYFYFKGIVSEIFLECNGLKIRCR